MLFLPGIAFATISGDGLVQRDPSVRCRLLCPLGVFVDVRKLLRDVARPGCGLDRVGEASRFGLRNAATSHCKTSSVRSILRTEASLEDYRLLLPRLAVAGILG